MVAVLTGKELVEDKIGNLICGWMIYSKDGAPMKMGAWPAMAPDTVRFVGQAVAVVIAETRNGPRRRRSGRGQISGASRRRRYQGRDRTGAPQLHPEAPGNVIYDWTIGDEAATDAAFKSAAHVVGLDITNNRLVPNPMEPRAAIADYDAAEEHFTLYHLAEPACRPPRAVGVLQHRAGAQAEGDHADVGGGFGSKIFIYPEEMVALWASKKVGRPVKWTSDRTEAFLTDAHGRDHLTKAELALDKDHKVTGLRVKTYANLGG